MNVAAAPQFGPADAVRLAHERYAAEPLPSDRNPNFELPDAVDNESERSAAAEVVFP